VAEDLVCHRRVATATEVYSSSVFW